MQDSVYSVPRSHGDQRDDTYNVLRRRSDGNVHSVKAASRNGKSRPSRSFESLFNRQITPLPDRPRTFSPPNLPSPTSKGFYIDIDLLERERRGESLYAEISEKPQPRYVTCTSPRRSPLPPIPKTTPPSTQKLPPANSVPESPSSALYAIIPGDDYRGASPVRLKCEAV